MTSQLAVAVEIGGQTIEAGTAYFNQRGKSLSTAFQYHRDYLAHPASYALDPALPPFAGQHITDGLPGAFSDCAPDRWGRNLISKRLRADALRSGRTPATVSDVDYLLGVSDLTRQGALRFRQPDGEEWVDGDTAVPKLVELPRLLDASDQVTRDSDDLPALKVLLAAGTGTLGGARPKASVRDGERLFIAKFPKPSDDWDVMAWEKTALDLAAGAGITVPACRLERIDGRGVLILERFDRDVIGRIGYMSAMTMLLGHDGDSGRDYVDVAETFSEVASDPGADLQQMWRRVAFSVAVHNTDDHLRNHGFLRKGSGWALSPVFDVNPNPDVFEARSTSIFGESTRPREIEALHTAAPTFGVGAKAAAAILDEVFEATAEWRAVAHGNGISEREMGRFADAFDGLR